ncbi:MAG: hypothetical protein U1F33_15945 [Alphaproteobacteria bacterium]
MRPSTALVLGTFGLLAACAESSPYDTGYRVGCFNGQVYAGKPDPTVEPDRRQYRSDAQYTKGFDDGVNQCYQQAMRFPQAYGGSSGAR